MTACAAALDRSTLFQGLRRYGSCMLVPWGGYVGMAWLGASQWVRAPQEGALLRAERFLFGGATAPELLAPWMRLPLVNGLWVATYLSFYGLFLALPAWLAWKGPRSAFVRLRTRMALAGLLGYGLYFLLPVRSPYYVLDLYRGPEFRFSQALVQRALDGHVAFLYDAFPSMHITFAVLLVLATGRLRLWAGLWLVILVPATMATGAHWGLDVAAGFLLAGVVLRVLRPLDAAEDPQS